MQTVTQLQMNVNDERINDHLAALDALDAADFDELVDRLITVAAGRGFTVKIAPKTLVIANEPSSTSRASMALLDREITAEIVADLIVFFENVTDPEELMNIYSTDLFKYLAGDMIGQKTISLTIASVSIEKMNSGRGGEQAKPCLHFRERDKLMVLNKTNASILAKELGPETDDWIGATVTIAAPMIEAFGKTTRSLKILSATPRPVAPKSRGNGKTEQPILDMDDPDAERAAVQTAQGNLD